jgi:hypothetical protein
MRLTRFGNIRQQLLTFGKAGKEFLGARRSVYMLRASTIGKMCVGKKKIIGVEIEGNLHVGLNVTSLTPPSANGCGA